MALLSVRDRAAALALLEEVRYVELSDRPDFNDRFIDQLGFYRIEVIACGALAGHIREIAARRGWPVVVRPLSAALHNRPEQITQYAERARSSAPTVLGYADCGSYGALDEFRPAAGSPRLPGLHCYDLYAGARGHRGHLRRGTRDVPADRLPDQVLRQVGHPASGLDRHPELWTDYFGHYTRLVWLAQERTRLSRPPPRIAGLFGLPLTRIDTGLAGWKPPSPPAWYCGGHTANRRPLGRD